MNFPLLDAIFAFVENRSYSLIVGLNAAFEAR